MGFLLSQSWLKIYTVLEPGPEGLGPKFRFFLFRVWMPGILTSVSGLSAQGLPGAQSLPPLLVAPTYSIGPPLIESSF